MAPPKDKDDVGPPGAGTLFVYGQAGSVDVTEWDKLPTPPPVLTPSPDSLLLGGIADYTYLPRDDGGVLGRGKFSTVYRVKGYTKDGVKDFALKHTPLYPHHPLIAARLLREPTLLAQLAPHPCLIGVDGFVRTEGHFYLVEECASTHVPLPKHPVPLAPSRAAYLLDQLVSVLRDGLHAGRVCHRDLKGDNVLVDVATGDILLLDLGLATHFSASEPKLTTCCGSPAFHSPEIVNALNHRPGEVTYYGPEVDIWCVGLTMLAMLLQTRFPLGPSHSSRHIMGERGLDRLQELDEVYPPKEPWRGMGSAAWRALTDEQRAEETKAWVRVRKAMQRFIDIDARRRMAAFKEYDVGDRMRARVEAHALVEREANFKTTTFLPAQIKYKLPLYFDNPTPNMPLVLRNPSHEPEKRILSYIKYLLRCAGILHHHVPDSHPAVLQIVLPLGPVTAEEKADPLQLQPEAAQNWVASLLGLGRKPPPRSASVPPAKGRSGTPPPQPNTRGKKIWSQQVWLRIECERVSSHSRAPSQSRAHSRAPSRTPSHSQLHYRQPSQSRNASRAPSCAGSRSSSAHRPPLSRASSNSRNSEGELSPLAEEDRNAESPNHESRNAGPKFTITPNLVLEPTTVFPSMGEIVTPATTAAPKLHRPGVAPSPLSRVASPVASTVTLPSLSPPTSPRPHPRRSHSSHTHTPRVTLTLTEPRGYKILQEALATAVAARGFSADGPPMSPLARALAIPSSSSSGGGSASASDIDPSEEEERGRPRSKDAPILERDERSQTVRPSGGSSDSNSGTPQLRSRYRTNAGFEAEHVEHAIDADLEGDRLRERERRRLQRNSGLGLTNGSANSDAHLYHPRINRRDRKPSGLLESIFGKTDDAQLIGSLKRSTSMPPTPRKSSDTSSPDESVADLRAQKMAQKTRR